MTSLTLASEMPSLAASLVTNASRSAWCCCSSRPWIFVSAARSLAWVTPSALASAGSPSGPGAVIAAHAVAELARAARAQVGKGGAQLRFADAELGGDVAEVGRAATAAAGLQLVERGADLGRSHAELARERVVEALEPVAAPLAADDLARPVELVERGRDLVGREAELGRPAPWRARSGVHLSRRGRGAGPRARREACPPSPRGGRRCRRGRGRGPGRMRPGPKGPAWRAEEGLFWPASAAPSPAWLPSA